MGGLPLATLLSNRSACHLRLMHHAEAEADASECLQLNPNHTKAFYRRALARRALGDLHGAVDDALMAQVCPSPPNSACDPPWRLLHPCATASPCVAITALSMLTAVQ